MEDFDVCDKDGNNMLYVCMLVNVFVLVFGVVFK